MSDLLMKCAQALGADDAATLLSLANQAVTLSIQNHRPAVTEVRPQVLECDVVRFQNNKEKWVAFVGLLDGYPYEIFTGLQDDDEGIVLPKTVTRGKILKQINADGTKRYDFQFENKRGYKTTVEGLSEKFNPEYWNYAKLISGVLRYRMPLEHVIRLVGSLSLKDESINTWKIGVERALKKYLPGTHEDTDVEGAFEDILDESLHEG
ncbi:MAG: ribonucleoside-triphosphate reductase [Prevotella sp.]|nr:ribonucleoside-triphosphate reductase [Prevotella sp.]